MSAEQMEVSRLRSELARVTMERDILGKSTAAQAACAEPVLIEVRLHPTPPAGVVDLGAVPGAKVSVTGYHQHFVRRASDAQRRHLSDDALLVHIKAVHAETHGGPGTC